MAQLADVKINFTAEGVSRVVNAVDGVSKKLDTLNSTTEKAASVWRVSFGTALGFVAGQISGQLIGALKTAALSIDDVRLKLIGAVGTAKNAAVAVASLTQTFLDLRSRGVNVAADAFAYLAQRVSGSVKQLAEAVERGSVLTGVSQRELAETFVELGRVWELTAEQMAQDADVVTAALMAIGGNAPEFINALRELAPTAYGAGLSLKELVAILLAFNDAGVEASQTVQFIRRVLLAMETGKLEELEIHGLLAQRGLDGVADVLDEIRRKIDALPAGRLKEVFGDKAALAVKRVVEIDLRARLQSLEIEKARVPGAAAQASTTFSVALTRFLTAVQASLQQLGNRWLPVFAAALNATTEILTRFKNTLYSFMVMAGTVLAYKYVFKKPVEALAGRFEELPFGQQDERGKTWFSSKGRRTSPSSRRYTASLLPTFFPRDKELTQKNFVMEFLHYGVLKNIAQQLFISDDEAFAVKQVPKLQEDYIRRLKKFSGSNLSIAFDKFLAWGAENIGAYFRKFGLNIRKWSQKFLGDAFKDSISSISRSMSRVGQTSYALGAAFRSRAHLKRSYNLDAAFTLDAIKAGVPNEKISTLSASLTGAASLTRATSKTIMSLIGGVIKQGFGLALRALSAAAIIGSFVQMIVGFLQDLIWEPYKQAQEKLVNEALSVDISGALSAVDTFLSSLSQLPGIVGRYLDESQFIEAANQARRLNENLRGAILEIDNQNRQIRVDMQAAQQAIEQQRRQIIAETTTTYNKVLATANEISGNMGRLGRALAGWFFEGAGYYIERNQEDLNKLHDKMQEILRERSSRLDELRKLEEEIKAKHEAWNAQLREQQNALIQQANERIAELQFELGNPTELDRRIREINKHYDELIEKNKDLAGVVQQLNAARTQEIALAKQLYEQQQAKQKAEEEARRQEEIAREAQLLVEETERIKAALQAARGLEGRSAEEAMRKAEQEYDLQRRIRELREKGVRADLIAEYEDAVRRREDLLERIRRAVDTGKGTISTVGFFSPFQAQSWSASDHLATIAKQGKLTVSELRSIRKKISPPRFK